MDTPKELNEIVLPQTSAAISSASTAVVLRGLLAGNDRMEYTNPYQITNKTSA